MAGLGLIHLGFLAATAAVAVPIAIHLLLRPRARLMNIGTLRFLHLVLKDSTRRRKLRRWLLFALRTTAILLLALLFARPFRAGDAALGRDREVVLLIDQSAVMAAVPSGKTAFAAAQEAANRVLQQLPEQTVTHLAYFDARGVVHAEEGRIDRGRKPGYAGADFDPALRWAADRMVLSSRPHRQVYLFSNLRRSGLRETSFTGLPPGVNFELVEVGQPLVKNLAVTKAEATRTLLRPQEPVVIVAGVFNAGPFAAKNVKVRLVLEGAGKVEQTQTVEVAPVSLQEVRFEPPIGQPGLYTGYVEVAGDDAFPLDDRRWLAFEARPPDRLLLVDGAPGRTVFGNETYYLEAALRLRLPAKGPPLTPYEPQRLAWTEGASLPELAAYRLVALCNVAEFGEGDVRRLQAFVTKGGSLLIFTGDRVRPEGYEILRQAGLLPAVIEDQLGPDDYHFATWDKDHPVLRPLSDPQQGDLRRINFHHLTRLQPVSGAEVLAAAQTGAPLLVEMPVAQGKVLLVASASDRDWSDWPQSRLYVPLIHQIVGYLTDRLPDSQRVRPAPTGPGGENPPGISPDGPKVVVRNLEARDSEIERLSEKQFRQAYHLPEPEETKTGPVAALAHLPPGSQRPDELWPWVIWALLLILVVELFIANRTHA